MILLLNKSISVFFKYFFFPFLLLVFILEIFFQVVFYYDIKKLKKTILFFNPYCDQAYWNIQGNSSYDKSIYIHHPTLTLIKKEYKKLYNENLVDNNDIIFYGSSFIDHKYFIPNFKYNTNLAVKSYGIDQIYESYMLTKDNFKNSNIIIGFLLEDIDRAIFDQRNFPKLKYLKKQNNFKITNVPISYQKNLKKFNYFYTYNLFKNLTFLMFNEFDYKKSMCNVDQKKDIFKFFIKNIISSSKKLNQNIIFITFNFKNDILTQNWRYQFVVNYFDFENLNHIDMRQVIRLDRKQKNLDLSDYYNNEDFHLSKYGYDLTKNEIDIFIKQYK